MNNLDIKRNTDWLNRTIIRLDGDHLVRHKQLFLLFQVDPQGILRIIITIFFDPKGILEIIIIIIIIIIVDPLGVLEIIINIMIVVNPEGMLERQCYSSSLDADSNYREVNSNNITQQKSQLKRFMRLILERSYTLLLSSP